jgi:GH15 family glucan-1,4-alpha-glucosidase
MQENLDYGVIGNCRSAALISSTGSIDWCCLPDFDSPSVFARLLDAERGGFFDVQLQGEYRISQSYLGRTNILTTRFEGEIDGFELIDFMPRYKTDAGYYHNPPEIIRYVRYLYGEPRVLFRYQPQLNYAHGRTTSNLAENYLKSSTASGQYESLYLYSSLSLPALQAGEALTIKGDAFFLISYNQKLLSLSLERLLLELERTRVYWMDWVERTVQFAAYNEQILRSALTLKLLTYHKTGAILAAVTTSLPETIGAVRNWDYRYCWIRDASMTLSTLSVLGHYNAARRFLHFIIGVIPYKDERIQIMYGIHGEKRLAEAELPWLAGYAGSRPVRIGNAAYLQKQNDIYGVLLDLIWRYFRLFRHTLANGEELWTIVRSLTRTVRNNWRRPDKGIWEFRSQRRHFTFSKVLCWVALDRAIRIAQLLHKSDYVRLWSPVREAIREDVLEHGWNEEVGAFTQSYESKDLDAANLLMQDYGFIKARDPRYVQTVLKIREQLSQDGLTYRYRNADDFGRPTTAFTVSTFWMIKSLYLIGRRREAIDMFEKVLGYANHLGLFSEGIDFQTKRLLGNFPQGYSHLALIDTAITLSGRKIAAESRVVGALLASESGGF